MVVSGKSLPAQYNSQLSPFSWINLPLLQLRICIVMCYLVTQQITCGFWFWHPIYLIFVSGITINYYTLSPTLNTLHSSQADSLFSSVLLLPVCCLVCMLLPRLELSPSSSGTSELGTDLETDSWILLESRYMTSTLWPHRELTSTLC
jgi:hypothetical protein